MDRRRFVAGAVGGLAAPLAGCTAATGSVDCSDPWDPGITAEEPTLAQGESDSIRIEVARTLVLNLGIPEADEGGVEVDVADASIRPSPDVQADSYPPIWYWDECTGVTVDVPVAVADDADLGEHAYSVTARQAEEHGGDSVTREFAVTVVAD